MGVFRERTVSVNGRMFYIQSFWGKETWLLVGLALAFTYMIWIQIFIAFHFPDDKDFASDNYREEAYKAAGKLLIETEKKAWNNRGFVEASKAARSMLISNMDIKSYKDIAEITKYSKNRVYEVHTGVEVSLSTTSNDEKTTIYNKNSFRKSASLRFNLLQKETGMAQLILTGGSLI